MPPGWVIWLALAFVVVTSAAVLLLVFVPPQVVPSDFTADERHRLAAEAAVRATILQCLAGLVVFLGLGFTARSVYVSRETHLTDRLTKAIDQLGHDRPEVRVGGIYALQRLALNSRVDKGVIANVLSGYLRIHAGASAPAPRGSVIGPDIQTAVAVLVDLRS